MAFFGRKQELEELEAAWRGPRSALITLWGTSLMIAGEIIDQDRWAGTLEATVATPTPLGVVVLGRVFAVVAIGSIAFVESWLAAAVLFGIVVPVPHPGWFLATLLATTVAMAGTATIMAAVFVLARSARTFQNSLSYPVYVLGGVLVPVALLPDWVQPLARVVFLSWSSDLFRDSLEVAPVATPVPRLLVVLALGAAGFALGHVMLRRILARVRESGSLDHA
jgi:ABC-2 type transport system permease protein